MDREERIKLYVGGLNDTINGEILAEEFNRFGKTSNVWVAFNPAGFGFVEYDTEEEANNAVQVMNGAEFHGCTLRVEFSHGRGRGRGGGRGGGFRNSDDRGYGDDGGFRRRGGYQDRGFGGRGGGRGFGGRSGGFGHKSDSEGYGRDRDRFEGGFRGRGGRGGNDRFRDGDRFGGGRGGRGGSFSGPRGRDSDREDDFNGTKPEGGRFRSRSPMSRRDDSSGRPRFGSGDGDGGFRGSRGFGGRGGRGRGGGGRRPPRDQY